MRVSFRPALSAILGFLVVAAPAAAQIDARMLRQPDVSATQIAFVYAGDIWVAPKQGGVAVRLSSPRSRASLRTARRSPIPPTTTATPTSTPCRCREAIRRA